ncbi:MAG: alpha amylase C-terminal domain-containing protein [Prevotellaceae bacterium]|jgi:1,4-alpha-glucan branching enzyme|nr:alpha amylase C-terminal domain-containing protein [Prevotellaceae bacterium]
MDTLNLIKGDSGLEPYAPVINERIKKFILKEQYLCGGLPLEDVANGHLYYGLHRYPDCWRFREKAPSVNAIYFVGKFSGWKPSEKYKMTKINQWDWEIEIPLDVLKHKDLYKLIVQWQGGEGERLPSYCRKVHQDDTTKIFSAQVWEPKQQYKWKYKAPQIPKYPLIYEAHIGMSSEEAKVSTFNEFRKNVLPKIADLGYNMIQLMAIQEHPYYGSFGYQVSNFFAVSSRFGSPDELKRLIDESHRLGIGVILDIVHSHSVNNETEGLSRFDGTTDLYFYPGQQGYHPVWDSRCFDYGKNDVLAFLLSNCKYWLEEFKFDGFRFDGVTSMMYWDHGMGRDFTDYSLYFNGNQDENAIIYLALANKLLHKLNPDVITIAEDVSGMPGLAALQADGGIGFDFRMAMGVADFWVKTIVNKPDESWHVGDIFYELTNKRDDEKTISYAESHDQAMVGDKTIIFRLIDKEMYYSMNVFEPNIIVDRGIALHKIIRLASLATAGNGYLNFMGNEFGHPEWIDFPRQGNNWSYRYARRQWSLSEDSNLKYRFLAEFDKAMIAIAKNENIFEYRPFAIVQHTDDQVLIFNRGKALFMFNFNPTKSFTDYAFEIDRGEYEIILNSDSPLFGGFNRVDDNYIYPTHPYLKKHLLKVYLPSRTVIVMKKVSQSDL